MEKKYWQSIEETKPGYQPKGEEKEASMMELLAQEATSKSTSRRDFLKWCGISFVSATVVSSCENPVRKAIPYLNQPETLTPGMASWYASSFIDGNRFCSILVKSRDGRPIKIEGNEMSAFSRGGTSAIVQASVLSLYDEGARYKYPLLDNNEITWGAADENIVSALRSAAAAGRRAYLVTPTLISPSTRQVITDFRSRFANVEVVTWDAISYEAIREAHAQSFNRPMVPDYHFDRADLIISFSADFTGTWLSPVTFASRYADSRRLSEQKKNMSRHIHFESGLSVTGSNADERIPVTPSQEMEILMSLYNELASLTGTAALNSPTVEYNTAALAQEIMNSRGRTLVVCGHDNVDAQILVNAINSMAQAYGNTVDTSQPLNAGWGNAAAMNQMIDDIERGNPAVVIFYNTNPVYNHPQGIRLRNALANIPVRVSISTLRNETALACNYVLPDNHYLESWNDAMPKEGHYALAQPVMQPIYNTRQFQSTLLTWMGQDDDFNAFIREQWRNNLFGTQNTESNFDRFWTGIVQAGVLKNNRGGNGNLSLAGAAAARAFENLWAFVSAAGNIQFMVYENVAMADGAYSNNPWLQELPDPVTKVTWDNFAAISPRFAREQNLADGDIIRINGIEVPVLIQPGQAYGCISVALGYGHESAGKSADNVGVNAFRMLNGNAFPWTVEQYEKTGSGYKFARTQSHHTMEGRPIVRESTLARYIENPKAGNEIRDYHLKHMGSLYPAKKYEGHHWVLMVDLNACTGCSTCVISCQAENNIPVIGKNEVKNRRIMHWMRIDRYYTGDAENPGVVFQPMMCQHCDHAPCENVCPVSATNHSHEGINQMAYNRCVGTKYCINNCPYKVRRFNWYQYSNNEHFPYHLNTDLGKLVLNPDVTVRERGVVEKCSFCIQRIQAGKVKAKAERRLLADGEVTPACASACPSQALVFGDLNDPDSRVARLILDPRNYHVLEEMHTLPTVGYLTKIRNIRG
jgi:Fe-S-cluster-containing dehydrogenase component/anaerobic selenocysteine-containing dehydrogenase